MEIPSYLDTLGWVIREQFLCIYCIPVVSLLYEELASELLELHVSYLYLIVDYAVQRVEEVSFVFSLHFCFSLG